MIVDDEVAFLIMSEQSFELEGYAVDTAKMPKRRFVWSKNRNIR